jgi:hypothetical protein
MIEEEQQGVLKRFFERCVQQAITDEGDKLRPEGQTGDGLAEQFLPRLSPLWHDSNIRRVGASLYTETRKICRKT